MTTKKIALIGAGQIGGTLALLASQKNFDEIVLFDVFADLAKGKALDLSQMASLNGSSSKIIGTGDYKDIEGAHAIIITAGFPRKPGMSREDLLGKNLEVINQVAIGVKNYAPRAFVIMITNPLDAMVYAFHKISGFDHSMVVGMAGMLDSARFRCFIAEELSVCKKDIYALVLGGHGDDMVPLPRFSTVSGIPLTELVKLNLLSQSRLDALIERTRKGGGEIVKLLGTGSAFYAPALSAIEMAESYFHDQKRLMPCATFLDGQYDTFGIFMGVPAIIGKNGIEKIVELNLNEEEKAMFNRSASAVKKVVDEVNTILG